jgi:hypothetical protein
MATPQSGVSGKARHAFSRTDILFRWIRLAAAARHTLFGTKLADYSWAHQAFSGIVVPTLRRSLPLGANGTVIAKPSLIDMEIFDAAFE